MRQGGTIMHAWVAFTSLILLWPDAVVSQIQLSGVVGQSVHYLVPTQGTEAPCWGRGTCSCSLGSNQFPGTNGYQVTFHRNKPYKIHGII